MRQRGEQPGSRERGGRALAVKESRRQNDKQATGPDVFRDKTGGLAQQIGAVGLLVRPARWHSL